MNKYSSLYLKKSMVLLSNTLMWSLNVPDYGRNKVDEFTIKNKHKTKQSHVFLLIAHVLIFLYLRVQVPYVPKTGWQKPEVQQDLVTLKRDNIQVLVSLLCEAVAHLNVYLWAFVVSNLQKPLRRKKKEREKQASTAGASMTLGSDDIRVGPARPL